MNVIKPITITDGMVLSNNIAPSPQPVWDIATAYSVNDEVQVASNHTIYNCNVANTGQDPLEETVDGNGDRYWIEISPTNDWAVFDGRTRKKSVNASSIELEILPNKLFTSLAILNLKGETLTVVATSASAGIVYNKTFDLRLLVDNWIDFYFSEIESIDNIVKLDLPAYYDMTLDFLLEGTGDVEVGEIILGRAVRIGELQYGSSAGLADYSTKEFDLFGDPYIVERGYNDTFQYDVWMDAKQTYNIKKLLTQFRAKPLVYVGNPEYQETVIYGFYKNLNAVLEDVSISSMLLEVEELS